jgi:predicted transposase/invertase (TIGR01784 family)
MTDTTLLDPKNDFVFKTLFADAPDLLTALINAVRPDEAPITVIDVLNPRIDPDALAGKFIVLDLLAQDAQGRRYNIEIESHRTAQGRSAGSGTARSRGLGRLL